MNFNSRRSVVYSTKGIVSSTQPLASAAGLKILENGGNAAEAAVAVAAAISVTEPMSNSIGGDAFALFYDAKSGTVKGFNGSGKSPAGLSVDFIREQGISGDQIPDESVHTITVPGAIAAWEDVVKTWGNGKLTLGEIIQPAIELAEEGFPVSEVCSHMWKESTKKILSRKAGAGKDLTIDGRAPVEGEIFRNPYLAESLKRVAAQGRDGFYKGKTADKIVEVIKELGGVMTHEDLEAHKTLFLEPVTMGVENSDLKLNELPPNGQGIVALQALGTINELVRRGTIDLTKMKHNSVEYLHVIIETLKYGFKDAEEYVTDVEKLDYDVEQLLSREYLSKRADLFDPAKANKDFSHGVINPLHKSDTVYFTVSDQYGNACSFITSVFQSFGSGVVPSECGFPLQNRGANFNLVKGTRNCLEPSKRPYHTIIPAMITKQNGDLYAAYGVMGGFNQPQGHLQVLLNLDLFKLSPQQALDFPRICLYAGAPDTGMMMASSNPSSSLAETVVGVEEGIDPEVVKGLESLGHKVKVVTGFGRSLFGRGQIIRKSESHGKLVWSAGSDPRGDGAAIPMH
ncbi:hypothetical protein TRVA0_001S05402 [Trichomonascus vanleenenianus]|uniref:gamma-glutamyltransferase family protein n=1 Tax=Trichomonascus vanleenenianus TaxID=2268995 RepID=UPI003ECB90B8